MVEPTEAASDSVNYWEISFIGAGLFLEIGGAAVIFHGIHTLWRVIAEENETFPRFLLGQVRATYQDVIDAASGLIGKPRSRSVQVSKTDYAPITDTVHAELSFGKLNPHISTPEAIAELEDRINRVHKALSDTTSILMIEREERRRSLETLRSDITGQLTSSAEEQRQRSVRALRAEIAGFWFITLGFVLQGVGSIIGAVS